MASESYLNDVVNLAFAMTSDPQIRQLFGEDPPAVSGDQLTTSLDVDSDNSRHVWAAVQTVHLAADAAVVAAEYLATGEYDEEDYARRKALNVLVGELGLAEIIIISIDRGTWHIRFGVNPRTDNGRKWLAAIGLMVGGAILCITASAIVVAGTLIATTAGVIATISAPDGLPVVMVYNTVDPLEISGGTHVDIEIRKAA